MTDVEKLINILKGQAQEFLLEQGEFYPFGTYVNNDGVIKPIAAWSGNDTPPSSELIKILENYIENALSNKGYRAAAVVIDVYTRENGKRYNALELRLYEFNKEPYMRYFKYNIDGNHIVFNS